VQNFAAIGPRSSEITRGEKNKPQQNLSPLPQAIAYGQTNEGCLIINENTCIKLQFLADRT